MKIINSIKIAALCGGLTVIASAHAGTGYAIHHNKHGDYSSLSLKVHYSDKHRQHRYRDKHRGHYKHHNRYYDRRDHYRDRRHSYKHDRYHKRYRGHHDHRYCNDYRSRSNFAYSLYFNNYDRLKHRKHDHYQSRDKHHRKHQQHHKRHDKGHRGHGRTSRN